MGAGVVTSARVTHDAAGVDDIADASPESQSAAVATLLTRPEIEEAFVLSTCNRVEAYVVAPDAAVGQAALEDVFTDADGDAVCWTDHDESLRHLLRVAAGLESVVVGEDQIIGQVRDAYEDARRSGGIGPMLETAVTKAIHVGERARTETSINEGIVSLGSAATTLAAADVDGGLEGTTALVVGAGEMGRLAARSLDDAGASEVIVANRTVSHADHVVSELGAEGDAVALEAIDTIASRADVVVAATGSAEPVLVPRHLDAVDREQVVVDLGQPRDVCPTAASLPSVTVYDLDDLETVTERTREQRANAAGEVEAMIDEEFALLLEQYKRTRADEVIAAMYESAERVKQREIETAISRLEASQDGAVTDEQREIVESMADSLVGQLLAPPTKSLREAAAEDDWSTINTALQLFDPEFGPEVPASVLESGSRSGSEFGTRTSLGAIDDD
ncbi:glutamyl-tRNA reductase [Halomontanus rarus]|uniref:glutamyl-tRNA reductase n=1 Tax=Halomontanus rarus TaxID=3034020 RepID=UPI0023E84CFB|nr:glutamyl-tRNA reductase [Halovivax sp. TS33]